MLSMSLTGFGYTNMFSTLFSEIESGSKTVTWTWALTEFPELSEAVKVTKYTPTVDVSTLWETS